MIAGLIRTVRLLVLSVGYAAPALFVALLLYAKFFTEGWGALALGPLFFVTYAAAVVAAVIGGILYATHLRTRRRDGPLILLLVLDVGLVWFANTHR